MGLIMLMSKSAYAKHRGVSRQTVYKWIEGGDLVMNGSKIDVEATEQRQGSIEANQDSGDPWPERTLQMTWGEFWQAVKAKDRKYRKPVTESEIKQYVFNAAREMGWNVEFLEDGGIFLDDGDAEHYFQQYNIVQNAELAIGLLRRELCYVAEENRDDLDNWSEEGIIALAEWI